MALSLNSLNHPIVISMPENEYLRRYILPAE
jgi:hypothetical protein